MEIGSNIDGASLGDDRFDEFFSEAERLGLAIFVHAANPTVTARLPGTAVGTFGFAAEIALAAASIIASGTAARYPRLRLAFSHGAGGFPLMLTPRPPFLLRHAGFRPQGACVPHRHDRAEPVADRHGLPLRCHARNQPGERSGLWHCRAASSPISHGTTASGSWVSRRLLPSQGEA